ncbi:MAG: hypothetical protein BGN83_19015 [Rhizobium sp. 63-7]|nr:MAG: hypothetical protein BGN83_19015 [Rhizobium sp. 63-7]
MLSRSKAHYGYALAEGLETLIRRQLLLVPTPGFEAFDGLRIYTMSFCRFLRESRWSIMSRER